jgi:hypothetical protein
MVKKNIFLSVITKTDMYDQDLQKSSTEATVLTATPQVPAESSH